MKLANICLFVLTVPAAQASARTGKIESYIAMGDSYASGNGAGSSKLLPNLDLNCGRFSEAYPTKIADGLGMRRSWWGGFHDKACAGATTASVSWGQLAGLLNKDFGTLQVGGNEVDFFPVLNECVQQWHPLSSCDRELDRARTLIQSQHFLYSFHNMIRAAMKWKNRETAHLFVVGYAAFFNEETDQCNNATFSFTNPASVLSRELRHSLNQLVRLLNSVIRTSAEAHGAVFIDIDEVFQGHRFCEEGIVEPHPDWAETWFFRETPRYQEEMPLLQARGLERRWKGDDGLFVGANYNPASLGFLSPLKKFAELTRTFHPTAAGHQAIADEVLYRLQQIDSRLGR